MAPRKTEAREKPVDFRGPYLNSEGAQRRTPSYSLASPPSGWLGAGEVCRRNRSNQGYHCHIQSTESEERNMVWEPHISRFQYGSLPMMMSKSSLSSGVLTWDISTGDGSVFLIQCPAWRCSGSGHLSLHWEPEAKSWHFHAASQLLLQHPLPEAGERELESADGGWLEALFTPDCTRKREELRERVNACLGGTEVASRVALPPGTGDSSCPDHHQPMSPAHPPLCVDSHVPRGVRIMTVYDAIQPYYIVCIFFSICSLLILSLKYIACTKNNKIIVHYSIIRFNQY